MKIERTSFGSLPAVRRQRPAVHWCDCCGRRYVGHDCPRCDTPPWVIEPPPEEEPDDTICQPGNPLGAAFWLLAIIAFIVGLIWMIGAAK